jgi:hypothetical protein
VNRAHYKDRRPNDSKLAIVTLLLWCAIFAKSGLMTLAL